MFRDYLFLQWNPLGVLGRIYVAHEGINAQLSLPAKQFETFKKTLDEITFLEGVRLNIAIEHDNKSFLKLTIKVRTKIVADGLEDNTFDVTQKGTHVNAQEFNMLLADKNTICVDMRNHYETEIGHFDTAITPDVDTFRDSLPIIEEELSEHKEDKKLLMYCTGGIRCEKASAYFKHKGFKNVYQLEAPGPKHMHRLTPVCQLAATCASTSRAYQESSESQNRGSSKYISLGFVGLDQGSSCQCVMK